jgi:hypothetical protein
MRSVPAAASAQSSATSLFSDIARLAPERSRTTAVDVSRVSRISPGKTVVPEIAGAPLIVTAEGALIMTVPSARDATKGPEA